MNRDKKLAFLINEAGTKLAEIRVAMQVGNRQLAVQLAAERYQLLQEIQVLKTLLSEAERLDSSKGRLLAG
jgi:hypothetical protein